MALSYSVELNSISSNSSDVREMSWALPETNRSQAMASSGVSSCFPISSARFGWWHRCLHNAHSPVPFCVPPMSALRHRCLATPAPINHPFARNLSLEPGIATARPRPCLHTDLAKAPRVYNINGRIHRCRETDIGGTPEGLRIGTTALHRPYRCLALHSPAT